MDNTALGAKNTKKQEIVFISEAHEKFYYEKLKEVRYQDVGGIVREENQTTSSLGCIICSNVYWWMFFVKANQAKEFEKNDYGVFLNADAS